jgi:hypothetical protein
MIKIPSTSNTVGPVIRTAGARTTMKPNIIKPFSNVSHHPFS